jgi:hypothetical protein
MTTAVRQTIKFKNNYSEKAQYITNIKEYDASRQQQLNKETAPHADEMSNKSEEVLTEITILLNHC